MSSTSVEKSRHHLTTLMIGGFICLLAFLIRASLERGILDNADLMTDVWFHVTIMDAYLGFSIFYIWVAWRENSLFSRILWFGLIMAFGNLATTTYVVIQVARLPKNQPASDILLRPGTFVKSAPSS